MLKQIIIISIFLSFCFGQMTLTTTEANQITKKINDLNNEIKELESDRNTLIKQGSNLGTTEESTDDMVAIIEGLIESYETNIVNLAAEIAKTELRKVQLEDEMGIHQKYHDELDDMRVAFQKKLSELAEKHRDVTNFRDEMEVKLSKEPTGSLDEEQGE
jgi:chromosome segregation ATPase|tara:strand:- start:2301 stop:2780 length:480 start_codon:yes stop_codon:yes gene_type:complete